MSEVKTETEQKKRVPYEIDIDHDNFNPIYDGKYLTSIEFCKLTNQIFHAAFINFHGSKFILNNTEPMIELYFTHVDKVPEPTVNADGSTTVHHIATQRFSGSHVGSTVIDKTRSRDNQMVNGDKYHVTEDGMDIIKPLLFPRIFNRNKPDWNKITTEISDQGGNGFYGQMNMIQLTKISGIDPKRVAALIWGRKDEEGIIDYGISVMRDLTINSGLGMPGNNIGQNFAINITRAHTDTISKTYQSLGLGTVGSSIIQ